MIKSRKKNPSTTLATCFMLLMFYTIIFCSDSTAKMIQEEVTVVAVEVPVRVLQKGQFVKNLTKEDFAIYENGVLQPITGFEVRSRRISMPVGTSRDKLKIQPEKRQFLLIFNIFDYQDYVGDVVDYFFASTFRKGDKIIILTEGNLFPIETRKSPAKVAEGVKETLKKFKVISTMRIFSAYQNLRSEADRLILALGEPGSRSMPWDQAVLAFYRNYERTWREYKQQFVAPDLQLYRSLIKRIKAEEGEKWALCFQQREMFPVLKNEGRLERLIRELVDTPSDDPMITAQQRNVRSMQMQLQRLYDVSNDLHIEELKKLFMEANITFHLLLLKSSRPLVEKDFEYREVGKDYEDSFRQISFSTGGHTVFSNKVTEALIEASQTEDYYYLLVYSPKQDPAEKPLAIDVEVHKEDVDIIHIKEFLREKILPVSIERFETKQKTIKFSILNYQRIKMENKLSGLAEVRLTIFDKDSQKVFEDVKVLQLIKDQTHISIPFRQLKSGSYFIIIQVVDKITNRMDVFSKQFTF